MSNVIKMIIEIPRDSKIKYEYNRANGKIEVDRILRGDYKYPANYGFIPTALDWDGDELDVLLYSQEKFQPGVLLNARVVGAMKMIDDGETDTKLIAIHDDDYRLDHIKTLSDLDPKFLDEVKYFFSTYKNWKREGITSVSGFEDTKWALQELEECTHLMDEYGKLPKKEFLTKMKTLHPEKYE